MRQGSVVTSPSIDPRGRAGMRRLNTPHPIQSIHIIAFLVPKCNIVDLNSCCELRFVGGEKMPRCVTDACRQATEELGMA
jgi:hypothetical protein